MPVRSSSAAPSRYFDPDASCLPAQGILGVRGRNTLRRPDFANVDLLLVKTQSSSSLGSAGSVQLRLEVFNLLTGANFSIPSKPVFAAVTAIEAPPWRKGDLLMRE